MEAGLVYELKSAYTCISRFSIREVDITETTDFNPVICKILTSHFFINRNRKKKRRQILFIITINVFGSLRIFFNKKQKLIVYDRYKKM